MNKLKKAAAVAAMVGGLGLAGGGVAGAHGGSDSDVPISSTVDNLQLVGCEQVFAAGAAFAPVVTVPGGTDRSIGNFCTVIGSVD